MASASSALPPLRTWTALIRLLFLAACVVVRGGGDDALVGTVNDLYIQARTFEDGSQMLLAMRTLTAAARLLPRDARVMKKLRSVHRDVAAFVPVSYEGATLTMPVWIPKTPGVPSEPGSADGMVCAPKLYPLMPGQEKLPYSCASPRCVPARELVVIM
jgi:hypothetical protein